jgi:hypothetical protein
MNNIATTTQILSGDSKIITTKRIDIDSQEIIWCYSSHETRGPFNKLFTTVVNTSSLNSIAKEYFKLKKFERNKNMPSEEVYAKWTEGKISGPEYSDWINSYIRVWDAIIK